MGTPGLAPGIGVHGPPRPPRWPSRRRVEPRRARVALGQPGRFVLADPRAPPPGRRQVRVRGPQPPRASPPGASWMLPPRGGARSAQPKATAALSHPGAVREAWPLEMQGPEAQTAATGRAGSRHSLGRPSRGPSTPAPEKPTVCWFFYQSLSLRSLDTF